MDEPGGFLGEKRSLDESASLIPSGAEYDDVDSWDESVEELLTKWHRRIMAAQAGHYQMADRAQTWNLRLGIPVVILTSFVGTSVFATLNKTVDPKIRIIVGSVSVFAAVLASLQTFLRYAERAERHRVAANRYEAARRDVEETLHLRRELRRAPREYLDDLRTRLDTLGRQSPAMGEKVWAAVRDRFDLDEPRPKRLQT